jgi:hypothetical protein
LAAFAVRSGRARSSPRPYSDDAEIERLAAELESEAEAFNHPKPTMPAMSAAPRQRSMPVTAPVSRDVPSVSTGRPQSATRITLSAAEVEIAHNSFSDSSMSNYEKEKLYIANKRLMLQKARRRNAKRMMDIEADIRMLPEPAKAWVRAPGLLDRSGEGLPIAGTAQAACRHP